MAELKSCAVSNICEEQTDPAHIATLHWLLRSGTLPESPGMMDWLSGQEGLFWISGKPGSGKSTAMKFLLHHSKVEAALGLGEEHRDWKIAGVFFTDRLSHMERSWRCILASMLLQLVLDTKELQEELMQFSVDKNSVLDRGVSTDQMTHQWDTQALQKALMFCKSQQSIHFTICYFMDALDEMNQEETSHRDAIKFITQLGGRTAGTGLGTFKICAASRPDNDISEIPSSYNGFKMQDWTRSDIRKYIFDNLSSHTLLEISTSSDDCSASTRLGDLVRRTADKSQGVFLWVRLIVEEMRDALTNGNALDIEDLDAILERTPDDIKKFFANMLSRVPHRSRKDALILFECVVSALQPLTLLDFWLIQEARQEKYSLDFSKEPISISDNRIKKIAESRSALSKRIQNLSGGLLELRQLLRTSHFFTDSSDGIRTMNSADEKPMSSVESDRDRDAEDQSQTIQILHENRK